MIKVVDKLGKSAVEIGKSTGREVAYLADMEKGRQVGKALIGTESEIKLDEKIIALVKDYKRKLILIHSHSNNASFSSQDVYLFCRCPGIQKMVLYGYDGTKYVIEKKAGQDYISIAEAIFFGWESEKMELMEKYLQQWKAGEDEQVVWKKHAHEIMQRLSKKYDFKYCKKRWKNGG